MFRFAQERYPRNQGLSPISRGGCGNIARAALQIVDRITASIEQTNNRRSEGFLTLRQGLGYCWSVAVVALPAEGQPLMEKWLATADQDV